MLLRIRLTGIGNSTRVWCPNTSSTNNHRTTCEHSHVAHTFAESQTRITSGVQTLERNEGLAQDDHAPSIAIAQWGRSSVSPFLDGDENVMITLPGGAGTGYLPVNRWAVMATDPATPPGLLEAGIDALLTQLRVLRRRPVFAAVPDPGPYLQRGLVATRIADNASIDLTHFKLDGPRMASLRHSVTSARRTGLRVVTFCDAHTQGVRSVSREWLTTKRGGELGFTLGRFDAAILTPGNCRVALDPDGEVVGFVTWRSYDNGRGRVLDLMRRAVAAPNPTMDALLAQSLFDFAHLPDVTVASLAAVPLSHGSFSQRIYPTESLRKYKEKFAPTWEPLWLIAPSTLLLPGALNAVANSYCPGGVVKALRRNA